MFHAPIPGSSRPELSHNANVVAGDLLEGNRHKPGYRSALSVTVTNPPILAGGGRVADHGQAPWYTHKPTA